MRAGHSRVGDRGSSARKHARVVGLHVRVRADHCRHSAVEPARHRHLLARRLRVEVEHDNRRLPASLVDELVDDLPRGDGSVEEECAEHVEHRDLDAVARVDDGEAATRRQRAGVRRTDDTLALCEVVPDPVATVRVIAERDDVRARV